MSFYKRNNFFFTRTIRHKRHIEIMSFKMNAVGDKWDYENESRQHLISYLNGFCCKLKSEYANLCLQYSHNDFWHALNVSYTVYVGVLHITCHKTLLNAMFKKYSTLISLYIYRIKSVN